MEELRRLRSLAELEEYRQKIRSGQEQISYQIAVCGGTGCLSGKSAELRAELIHCLKAEGLFAQASVKFTGCLGLCECGPIVIVSPGEIFYQNVHPQEAFDIVEKTLLRGELVERLLHTGSDGRRYIYAREIPFLNKQQRVLLEHNCRLGASSIEDYLALGGYGSLARALATMDGPGIIETVKKALLRGRGGAGFPTGTKWAEAYRQKADQKYIICNADEGDPGAFMDRSLLEGNPHSVLEGLIIGGYAIGARQGIVFVRSEYPTAVNTIRQAIAQAETLGLLGDNILGSGFHFNVAISLGAGAFVSGETSALVRTVEGRVGEPRQKPPHLTERGLYGKPTVVNNVETLANIPYIIRHGPEYYQNIGTAKSKGTKIFSLVGKVIHTGLVEVPLGITLRELIFDIGGGIRDGKKFKAVQTGGPSGGCLPEQLLDLPVDYEELAAAGSMMGSGGMIVMDEDSCMVDLARYFLAFLKGESCGACFTCREGISRMLEMVEEITRGEGSMEQLDLLEELAHLVKESTLCGLGQSAPNPVLSTLRYFRDEYHAHIAEKRCPAKFCSALISYTVLEERCTGCGACLKRCPAGAVKGQSKAPHRIVPELCTKCGSCLETCRYGAVLKA